MSGIEFVKGLASGMLPLNTIAQTLGYDVAEAESGRVVITLHPTGAHLNPWGTVHGGLTAILLDSCMGLAIQSTLEKGIGSTTLEFKISLVRAITLETGQIRAEGKVLNCGRRVGTAEGRGSVARARHDDLPHFFELTLQALFAMSALQHRTNAGAVGLSAYAVSSAFFTCAYQLPGSLAKVTSAERSRLCQR
jgi:uncharacterized protein (TIGR00369 family)